MTDYDRLTAEVSRLTADLEAAQAKIADYENGILWFTNCTNCAHLMDQIYDLDQVQLAAARQQLDAIRALCQSWRSDRARDGYEATRANAAASVLALLAVAPTGDAPTTKDGE
jgi:hypothetical protein